MEQETRIRPFKSLSLFEDTYHIWLTMGSYKTMDINISDNVSNTVYHAAEFDGHRYNIKNERIFNDVFIKAVKKNPFLVKQMFAFLFEQTSQPDTIKDMKIKFTCFKRKINIYIHKRFKDTKKLLWD